MTDDGVMQFITESENTMLHSCCARNFASNTNKHVVHCGGISSSFVYINPSSFWFTLEENNQLGRLSRHAAGTVPVVQDHALGVTRVLYANHSSHSELLRLIDWLKPYSVTPITQIDDMDDYVRHFPTQTGGKLAIVRQPSPDRSEQENRPRKRFRQSFEGNPIINVVADPSSTAEAIVQKRNVRGSGNSTHTVCSSEDEYTELLALLRHRSSSARKSIK